MAQSPEEQQEELARETQRQRAKVNSSAELAELVTDGNTRKAADVKRGIDNYLRNEADREIKKREIEIFQQQNPGQSIPEMPKPTAAPGIRPLSVDRYFTQIPQAAGVNRVMQEFVLEATKALINANLAPTLDNLTSEFLVENNIRLLLLAEEEQVDLAFLKQIQAELTKRKIALKALEKQAKRRKQQQSSSGGQGALNLNLAEITDPLLRAKVVEINRQIAIAGEQEGLLSDRYKEVSLMPTGLGAGPEKVDIGQKQKVLDAITEAIVKVQRRTREGHEAMELEREKVGWLGYRTVTTQDKADILKEINDIARWVQSDKSHILNAKALKGDVVYGLFNRMFDRADSGLRDEFAHAIGQQGEYEKQEFNNAMNQLKAQLTHDYEYGYTDENGVHHASFDESVHLKRHIIDMFREKFEQEYKMRELLHNTFTIAENEGDFKDFTGYCKQFSSSYADLAFESSPEVEVALRVREYVLYQIKRENNGRIPPEKVNYNPAQVGSEWEKRTKNMIEEMNNKGLFGDNRGERVAPWRISRAISISRGMGMVLLRFPSIVAETDIDAPVSTYQALAGSAWQKLVWGLNPMWIPKVYGQAFDMRGLLYIGLKRSKKGFWNQDEIRDAIAQEAVSTMITMGDDEAMINLRNMFLSGGPFNHTGWRPYVAALDESRNALKPLLARNAGIAMNLIYHRYELKGQNKRKWAWRTKDEASNPDRLTPERLKEWERISAENKEKDEEAYHIAQTNMWKNAPTRIPHVILRIISDPMNRIFGKKTNSEIIKWKKSLATRIGIDVGDNKKWNEVEEDLVLAKENLMRRRRLALASLRVDDPNADPLSAFPADKDQLLDEDFELITDTRRRSRAKAFRDFMVSEFSKAENETLIKELVRKSEKKEFAFEVTAEDIPWSEFCIGQTGARGFFTRKINDALECAEASSMLQEFMKHMAQFKSSEEIVQGLQKIYDKIEIYDKDVAQDSIAMIATGLIRFFEKDGIMKIPLLGEFMGPINAMNHRGASFAQTAYGGKAMAWDETDIRNFTEMLRGTLSGTRGFEIIQKMRKETGGTLWGAIRKQTKLALYLLLLFGTAEMIEKVLKEK